jgi:hypothetical protein
MLFRVAGWCRGEGAGPASRACHLLTAVLMQGFVLLFACFLTLCGLSLLQCLPMYAGAKVQDQPAEPATIQDTIIWSSHTLLQAHLLLLLTL